jgi:signal transduction histidine kinase
MCWDIAADFPSDALSPGRARRFCSEQIPSVLGNGVGRDAVVEDTVIVVSELVTNSVNAGSSAVRVELTIHRGRLRVSVHDDAPGTPKLIQSAPEDVHGRGLAITATLAEAWGTHPTHTGKQVWAELTFPGALADKLECLP